MIRLINGLKHLKNMKIIRYKCNYKLIPNFLAYRNASNSEDYLFIQELFTYPYNKKVYNVGIWHIKYKPIIPLGSTK